MRKVKPPKTETNEEWEAICDTHGSCDNNNIHDCLKEIDKLLLPFNLEVVILDIGSSDYMFRIEPRVPS